MSRILAIGSEGNVGKPLVSYLRTLGHEVYESDIRPGSRSDFWMADINQPLDLLDAFDTKPEIVFLMAAVVSRVTCEQAGSLSITTNLAGVNNVLQLSKRVGARVIYFSTSEVYGPFARIMDEDSTQPRPNNRYGLSKYLGEQLVEYEVANHGLHAVTVRPFMFYDENEDLGDHRSAMIRFAQHLSRGETIEVHQGTSRSWMHMSDAVAALARVMYLPAYHVINIGHPDVVPTTDLAEMIRDCLGVSSDLIDVVDQPNQMTPTKRPALDKQQYLLRFTPKVGIADGVRRVCARFA